MLLAAMLLAGCGSSGSADSQDEPASTTSSTTHVDEDEARDQAASEVADKSFEDVGDTGACTEDCGGHDAGFQYAKDNGLTSADDCPAGDSASFEEGCRAYGDAIDAAAQDKQDDAAEEGSSGED